MSMNFPPAMPAPFPAMPPQQGPMPFPGAMPPQPGPAPQPPMGFPPMPPQQPGVGMGLNMMA